MEACFYIRHGQKYYECWISDTCIVNINIHLHLDMPKGDWGLACNGGDLIHDNVSGFDGGRTIPTLTITLPHLNHHGLSSLATVWRETTHDLIKRDQMALPVFLIHCLKDQIGVIIETF
jgi:hypothetical protein